MEPLRACPPLERWREHLDGTASPAEQCELTAHLDVCSACQKALESLAAGGDSLLGLARQMGGESARTEGASTPEDGSATTAGTPHESAAPVDEELGFLAPSVKPGHLGRVGHYEILELIGKGAFGIVLKAFDEKLHRVVAIKVLSPQVASSGTARKRFTREAQAAAAVAHEHVVTIHAVEDEHNPPYLVMQCIEGMSLQDKLDKEGPLELREILRIGLQTAEGLAAAHKQGLVHRDIKPANILLENGVERVKITDFGLARAIDDASLTQSGVVAGTPMYMSPEQAEGLAIDHRSDLFSLGTLLYVMCTGRPPFRATGTMAVLKRVIEDIPRPIREINPEIPDWLADIIGKLHAKKPEGRYQSARAVADEVGEKLAELQFTGRTSGVSTASREGERPESAAPVAHPPGSPKRRWIAAALMAGALAILLAFHFWPRDEEKPAPPDNHPPVVKQDNNEGWVKLFNGKDLTGWKYHPQLKGGWTVKDGILRSGGPANYLYSERGDFADFHLRAEVRATDPKSASALILHSPYGSMWIDGAGQPGWNGYAASLAPLDTAGTLFVPRTEGAAPERVVASPDLASPGEWFTIEVIAQGARFTTRINGKPAATGEDPKLLYKQGHLALQQLRPDEVIEFRKIEIKELPPSPSATQPFVVLARDRRAEQTFTRLKDAVDKARSGDTIEIRGNGPFQTVMINLEKKALTIRAGDGFRPHLKCQSRNSTPRWSLLHTEAPLVLEGLILERVSRPGEKDWEDASVVSSVEAPFHASHCRLIGVKMLAGVRLEKPPAATIQNSEILGGAALYQGILYGPKSSSRLSVENNVIAARFFGLRFSQHAHDLEKAAISLRHNTMDAHSGPITFDLHPSLKQLASASRTPALSLDASGNILAGGCALLFHAYHNSVPLEEAPSLLPKVLAYQEQLNLHTRTGGTFLATNRGDLTPVCSIPTLPEWQNFWKDSKLTSRVGIPVYQGGDVFARSPGELTRTAFRLVKNCPGHGMLPGGKDVGADVDRVGPGKPYEEWKKTPDYREWQKQIEAMLQGK